MKKIILFISVVFVAISFNSCNNDDDEVVILDKIIGEWQWDQEFEDGEEYILSACEKQSTIEFFQAGTFTSKDFYLEFENDVCTAQDLFNGTWKNLGNSMYEIEMEIESGVSMGVDVKITFTNNKMTIEFSFTDEDDVTYELKEIYMKI
jgi:hypothetical protein